MIIATWTILLVSPVGVQDNIAQQDHCAQIGNRAQATRIHLLEDKLPPLLPEKELPEMKGKGAAFKPIDKMDTEEELKWELALMRERNGGIKIKEKFSTDNPVDAPPLPILE